MWRLTATFVTATVDSNFHPYVTIVILTRRIRSASPHTAPALSSSESPDKTRNAASNLIPKLYRCEVTLTIDGKTIAVICRVFHRLADGIMSLVAKYGMPEA